ncbi:hypothetical protein COF54_09050 [Bacillus toyonensis]|uniref:HNH endonuclease n=1 Tax=Bacillus toyonensis TaxID=155322 RepID=UPI000BEB71EB|nr:hypothetical protein [Bacillus toyonensis]PEC36490.1 hypothetical protein CON60_26935 [Bacillus toyonensis]PED61288.1 hypothetical protein CON89_10945 [Bacillus toyonensis]PEN40345.1 hypothetical protein CN541_09140 [Bacillus toyonensis]PEP57595.1 hypothetical protein CN574_30005 [Bacillus toyonensis]PHC49924.1 hypothetical protein COF34_28990 [Bacillus toyonensis]
MRFINLLPYEEHTPEELFNNIVSNKNSPCKQILYDESSPLCIKPHILKRFNDYFVHKKSLENISIFLHSKQQQDCLEGCYNTETVGKKKLIALIKGNLGIHSTALCCYCGISRPTTIDHYLPKSVFPEYSVYSYNLIPCCAECNNLKSQDWIDPVTNNRLFVNFYFDDVPDDIYLFARIISKNNSYLVEYYYNQPNNSEIYNIINTHLTRLNITTRLEEIANSHLDSVYHQNQAALYAGTTPDDLKMLLRLNNQTLERIHGKNFWEVVLNRAILNTNSFFTVE